MFDAVTGKPTFRYLPRVTSDVRVAVEYQMGWLDPSGWLPVVRGVAGLALREESDGRQWIDVIDAVGERLFVRPSATSVPTSTPLTANSSFESPHRTGVNPAYTAGVPDEWTFTGSVNWGHRGNPR